MLDVSHGQADNLKFLARYFSPKAVVGYDSIRRQFTNGTSLPPAQSSNGQNLAHALSHERRFDLILCIETWSKLTDQQRFLH